MLPRFPVWQYTSYSNTSCHVFSMLIWCKHPSHLHAFISCLPCIAFNAFNNCFIWSISSEIKTNLGLLPSLFLPLINPRWFRTSLSLTAIEIYFGSYVLRDMWKRLFIPKSHPAVMMSPAKHGMGSVGLLPKSLPRVSYMWWHLLIYRVPVYNWHIDCLFCYKYFKLAFVFLFLAFLKPLVVSFCSFICNRQRSIVNKFHPNPKWNAAQSQQGELLGISLTASFAYTTTEDRPVNKVIYNEDIFL